MGNSTISMAIFNSYLYVYQRVTQFLDTMEPLKTIKIHEKSIKNPTLSVAEVIFLGVIQAWQRPDLLGASAVEGLESYLRSATGTADPADASRGDRTTEPCSPWMKG